MSFDGHVLWKRMLIGPCALTTVGATTVAAVTAAAPRRNLRRVADLDVLDCSVVMGIALLGFPGVSSRLLGAAWVYEPPGQVLYSGSAGCTAGYGFTQGSNCLARYRPLPAAGPASKTRRKCKLGHVRGPSRKPGFYGS